MRPRSALVAAMVCGAAAVLIVGVDTALNVDATLEVRAADGSWQAVSSTRDSNGPYVRTPTCGTDYRLTLHNGFPWSSTSAVVIARSSAAPDHQTWTLSAGETRSSQVFHLNATAPSSTKPVDSLQVQVGTDFFASASPCPEAKP